MQRIGPFPLEGRSTPCDTETVLHSSLYTLHFLLITHNSLCMDQHTYTRLTGVIFLLIAVLHLLRILYRWGAVIGGWSVPLWLSWVALIIGAYLAWWGLSRK